MFKRISVLIATVLTVLVIPASTAAAAATTDITGTVTNGGKPVKGATVTIVCDNHTKNDTTNKSGSYLVTFTAKRCPMALRQL